MIKEAKSAEAKLQHYVPQYYLRGFIDAKEQLYVVDRPRKKFFRVPTKKVGGELYFNLINIGGTDPFAVEKALSELEDIVAPALKRIKAAKSLADEKDRSAIMNLIASVTVRNPKQREAINEIVNQVGQLAAADGLSTKEKFDEFVSVMKAQGREVGVTYEEMKDLYASNPGKFKPTQEFNILTELRLHDHLVRLYEGRKWQIVVASGDSGGFVTSDHPVYLRWSDGQDHGSLSPGLAVPDTEVIFPISPQLALRGSFEGGENVVEADTSTVAGINSQLISNAHNQVYAQDALFKYKRGPSEEIGSGATLDQDQVFLAGGKQTDGEKVVALRTK
ncbi:MAG: hypothetical protein JWP25_320 [Bradyrhizobium sp.]|nr:hypothetical protein [Bradyrhizobium sp.]